MTADDIINQANNVMDILMEWYPEYKHVLIYDNAPTHLRWPDGLILAHQMPQNSLKEGHNWGIEVTKCDDMGISDLPTWQNNWKGEN